MNDLTKNESEKVALVFISAVRRIGRIDGKTNKEKLNKLVARVLASRQHHKPFCDAPTKLEKVNTLGSTLELAFINAGLIAKPATLEEEIDFHFFMFKELKVDGLIQFPDTTDDHLRASLRAAVINRRKAT